MPFDADEDESQALHVLREGVPPDLRGPLIAWLLPLLTLADMFMPVSEPYRVAAVQIDLRLDLDFDHTSVNNNTSYVGYHFSRAAQALAPMSLLRIVDYAVFHFSTASQNEALESLLQRASSKYMVAHLDGNARLQNRLPEGVQLTVESLIATSGSAGTQLAKAWSFLYGVDPKPVESMAAAVKAVETAAIPVVIPKKTDPTLGHVIGEMTSNAKWGLPLRIHGKLTEHHQMLIDMLNTLWVGHEDRHGGTDPVTFAQAQTSVHLAATLVAWFSTGLVDKR